MRLSMEEHQALKRIDNGAVVYQGGVYTSDGVDCLWSLPAQVVARVMGRVAGWGLARPEGDTLVLTDAGKKALLSGHYDTIEP